MSIMKFIHTVKILLLVLVGYVLMIFLYFIIFDINLGKGFVWACYEPGCSVINKRLEQNPADKNLMPGITGNITELNVDARYIVGKVGQPNSYATKHNLSDKEGYFILDKIGNKKKLGMTQKDFLQECKNLSIDDCHLKSSLFLMYDFDYWHMRYNDKK